MSTRLASVFLSFRGRISRSTLWYSAMFLWATFVVLFVILEAVFGRTSTLLLYLPFFWTLFAVSSKRYHDLGRSAAWLLLLLIPLLGVTWVAFELGFRKGVRGENRYGADPLASTLDYRTVR